MQSFSLARLSVCSACRAHAPPRAAPQVRAFRGVLLAAGRVCTLRVSKGDDENAACGMLGDTGLSQQAGKRPVPVAAPPPALKDILAGAAAMVQAQSAGSSGAGAAGGCA